jgi:hypothetical protein
LVSGDGYVNSGEGGGGSCFADVLVLGEARDSVPLDFIRFFWRVSERESRWGLFWGGLYESVRMGFGIGFNGVRSSYIHAGHCAAALTGRLISHPGTTLGMDVPAVGLTSVLQFSLVSWRFGVMSMSMPVG